MFHSKSAEDDSAREKLTGLERARLEQAQQRARPAPMPPAPVPVQSPSPVKMPAPVPAPAPAKVDQRAPVRSPATAPRPVGSDAQLSVGPGVIMKGDIINCDLLRIEGIVEGDVKARKLIIAAGGAFVGTAEINEAEVEGRFEGSLAVGGLLVLRGTGRATGKFAYGEIEIERGGQLSGEVQAGKRTQAKPLDPKAPVRPPNVEGASSDATTLRTALWPKVQ